MAEASSPVRLRLDGDALVANWRALAKLSGGAATGAAVKADGYGLGAREVVTRLRDAGCRDFFVAHWAEAAVIADLVPAEQIAVLNGIDASDIASSRAIGAIPVLNTPNQIVLWKAAGGGRCHVMLDSGINRLGIGSEQFSPVLFDGLNVDILMSHLASADEDIEQNGRQVALFSGLAERVNAQRRSLANSAGIMLGSQYHFDLTRPGLSLYGGTSRPDMAHRIAQVAYVSVRILQVRELQAGDAVGYNATHVCAAPTRVATLSIGYADGYFRSFSSTGKAAEAGLEFPVVGRVSMDLVTVDLTAAHWVGEGDWIDIAYNLPEASRASGLSQYELLTGLGDRFERRWF